MITLVLVILAILKLLSLFITTFDSIQKASKIIEKEFLDSNPSQNLGRYEAAEITSEMEDIIKQLRDEIEEETKEYELPLYRNVEQLFPEIGGTPMRSLVITTYRSGSTFIGGVLDSHPATFYHPEPLIGGASDSDSEVAPVTDLKSVQVRGEPLATPAIKVLRSLLSCDYRDLGRYFERRKPYTWLYTYNTRLWKHCSKHKDICWLPQFMGPACKLFPFQAMKTCRIRLRLVESLLADPKLNVRVVYLVRDPRGIMESRSTLGWCQKHEDCSNPVNVCADSVDDYSAALRFTKLFPNHFKIIRYEDMSLRPDEVIPGMFKFFGLQYHPDVQQFVKQHTTQPNSDNYSIYRNSTANALRWRAISHYNKVKELQDICRVALSAWGYLPAHNASHLLTFNPLNENIKLP